MKTAVFLLSGDVATIVSEIDLAPRPGEVVIVRCASDTTFEQILDAMLVGYGLIDEPALPNPLNAVAMIRVFRSFLATLPRESMRPVLVLEDGEDLPRGVIDRLRYLAPVEPGTGAGAGIDGSRDGCPPREEPTESAAGTGVRTVGGRARSRAQWAVAATAAAAVVAIVLMPKGRGGAGDGADGVLRESPDGRPAQVAVATAEMPLESAGGFLVRLATFETAGRAISTVHELESAGVPAFIEPSGSSHRVVAGPYASEVEAAAMLGRVRSSFADASVVAVP